LYDGTTRRRHDVGVEFGAPKPIRENGPRLITEHTKLTKGTKKTRILFDGLRPVGGAALRAVMEVRVGWITSRRGFRERLVIQPTLTSTNAGRFRPASPPTGETVDTWLVAFVSFVFFVILSAKAPKAPMAWAASCRRIALRRCSGRP